MGVNFTDDFVFPMVAKFEKRDAIVYKKATMTVRLEMKTCTVCNEFLGPIPANILVASIVQYCVLYFTFCFSLR